MDKDLKGQVTFSGSVTINGPMFDIHDNERVELHNHYESGVCARDKDKIQPLGVESLNIPEDVWERLREAGKVDEIGMPTGSNADKAMLAMALREAFGLTGFAPFERAWGFTSGFLGKQMDKAKNRKTTDWRFLLTELHDIIGC